MMAMEILIHSLGAFGAVVSLGVLLELPKRYLLHAGAVGGIGWMVYQIAKLWMENGQVPLASFYSSLVVAGLSHIFARRMKAPVTVFLVAGILPLVPGASIYRCVYYMIQNSSALSNYYLVETLQVAGAIAMAIFFVDSLFRVKRV